MLLTSLLGFNGFHLNSWLPGHSWATCVSTHSGSTMKSCGTTTIEPFNYAMARWPNTKSFHLQVWRQFVCEDELEKVYKSHSHWMLYVLVKKSPMGRNESWRTGERRGVGEPSSLAAQWLGDVPGPTLFCREIGKFFVLSGVHCCSEKLQWGRVWMVEWKCRLVTARLGIVVLLGTVGKCQPTKGNLGTCGMRAFFSFLICATFHNIWQASLVPTTNNFQLL